MQLYCLPGRGGQYPIAKSCETHVGELDWQSSPDNVTGASNTNWLERDVVKGAGHMLPKGYVEAVLEGWLTPRIKP